MKKRDRSKPFLWFSIFVVILICISIDRDEQAALIEPYIPVMSDSLYWSNNGGSAWSMDSIYELTDAEIQQRAPATLGSPASYNLIWSAANGAEMASAMGTDLQHHFVQSYLSKYKPFETEDLWMPLYTIASRKAYMYDHKQYPGFEEVWQHSIEAYKNTRGDCEDHSMILCDWLNALGYEARVATGNWDGNGHAWVVLYSEGQAFILEATKKSNLKGNSHYPLANLLPAYYPERMFDHDHYFVPKPGLRVHDKEQWVRSSVLKRNVPL